MSRIMSIKSTVTKATGAVKILVSTPEREHWVPYGQWINACKAPLDSYVGGDFVGFYFKEGDTMLNGSLCSKSDIILEDFVASPDKEVLALAHARQSKEAENTASELNALYQRKRKEAQAKAELAQKAPVALTAQEAETALTVPTEEFSEVEEQEVPF